MSRIRGQAPDDATLLWYSDGLVERRGEVIDDGLRRLADAAAGLAQPDTPGWCDALLSALADGQEIRDDLVLVRLRLRGRAELRDDSEVLRRVLTSPDDLGETQSAIRRWATARALSDEQIEDLLLACGEALANALEHAHCAGKTGTVVPQGRTAT